MAAQFSRYATYVEPLVKTKKSKAYTMLVLSLFTIAFFGLFAIRPTLLTIVALQNEIKQAKEVDQKLADKIQALTAARETLTKYKAKQGLIAEAIPPTPNIAHLMSIIERHAQESIVQVGNIQVRSIPLNGEEKSLTATNSAVALPQQSATSSAIAAEPQEIKFSFTVTGSDTGIIDFIQRLNQTRRIIVLNNAGLRGKDGTNVYTIELSGQAYQLDI